MAFCLDNIFYEEVLGLSNSFLSPSPPFFFFPILPLKKRDVSGDGENSLKLKQEKTFLVFPWPGCSTQL